MLNLSRLSWLIVCLLAMPTLAQESSYELDKVEIQARDSKSILGDSALRTMIISSKDIQMAHAKTLDDALRYTPGIDIKPLGDSAENGSGISIQGLDPSQVLIMIDGNPVAPNSGDMVDTVDISQVLIGDVESIEIIQGGASAIYGANAMGGVVNIITKTPSKAFSFSADISTGDWGSKSNEQTMGKRSAILTTSGKAGAFYTQLTSSLLKQDGFDSNPEEIGSDGWHGYKNNFSGKLRYDFNNANTITISPSIYRAETATHQESKAINHITKERISIQSRDTFSMTYLGVHDSLHYKIHAMNQTQTEEKDSTSSDRLDQSSKNNAYSLKMDQPLSGHLLSLSLNHKYEYLEQYNLSKEQYIIQNKSKRSSDIALSDSWYFYSYGDFEIVPAIRFNQDENYSSHTSPMLSVMYSNDQWFNGQVNIRTSITDGYKAPTLMELYWEFDHNGDIMYFGNPELVPETSINTQLGIEFISSDHSRFELHVFNNDITNLIAQQSNAERAEALDGVNTVYEFENVKKARTKGVNLSAQKKLDYIALNLSYSYLDATNLETGKQLPKKSKNQLHLGLDIFNQQNSQLSFKYRFNSKQYTDFDNTHIVNDYDVIDMKFNQDISKNFSWYLGVDNILDNSPEQFTTTGAHSESGNDAFPITPRYMYVGFRFKH